MRPTTWAGTASRILTNEMTATNRDQVGARLIQNWTALLER